VLDDQAQANWPITSKPVSPAPRCWWASPSKASAASIEGTAAHAVSVARGSGYSFMVAPVITPSVPSLPMNRSRRS
jgi:hypothetical protein